MSKINLDKWFQALYNVVQTNRKKGFQEAHEEMELWRRLGTDKYLMEEWPSPADGASLEN